VSIVVTTVIVATLLIIAVPAVAGSAEYARRRTRASFGPEYEDVLATSGSGARVCGRHSIRWPGDAQRDLRGLCRVL
jgi:hypothetical protein